MITLNETGFFKSWLYRLAYWGVGFENCDVPTNICPFIRKCFLGLFIITLTTLLSAGAILTMVFAPIVNLMLWLFTDNNLLYMPDAFIPGMAIWFILTLIFMWFTAEYSYKSHVKPYFQELSKNSKPEGTDSSWYAIKSWLKSIHDKTCVPVKFK